MTIKLTTTISCDVPGCERRMRKENDASLYSDPKVVILPQGWLWLYEKNVCDRHQLELKIDDEHSWRIKDD